MNLLRRLVETPSEDQPSPSPTALPLPQRPVVMAARPRSIRPEATTVHQNGRGVELPLQPILAGLPQDLQPRITNADPGELTVSIPLEKVLAQLSRGVVHISFGELRQAAPDFFTPENDRDRVLVALPLGEILARLNPALIARRRAQKLVQVPPEISSPFDRRNLGVVFTVGPTRPPTTPTPGPALPTRQAAVPAPTLTPPAGRTGITFTPTPTPPTAPPVPLPEMTPGARPLQAQAKQQPPVRRPAPEAPPPVQEQAKQQPPAAHALPPSPFTFQQPPKQQPVAHPAPTAPLSLQEPVKPQPPTPRPAPAAPSPVQAQSVPQPAVPFPSQEQIKPQMVAPQPAPAEPLPTPSKPLVDPTPLVVGLTSLAEGWPEAIRKELVQLSLVDARVALPSEIAERALKQGRVAFTWKTLRSWITPAPLPTVSAHDNSVLELPLKVVAPLFLARQKQTAKLHQKVTIDEDIPNLFFGFPQPEAGSASVASVASTAPPKPQDTNFYVWDDTNDTVRVAQDELKRGPSLGTKFVAKYATPNEVVSRAAALDGVAGALIALPDGLMVASRLAPECNGDTLAAFLPQIFGKITQCTKELRMGELNNVSFTVGNIPWKIFRVNAIFFAAFGRAGEPLPTVQLAALAGELDHKPK